MWIGEHLVMKMVLACGANHAPDHLIMLFLCTYCFLLRLPSEALPIVWKDSPSTIEGKATMFMENNTLVLLLARRPQRRRECTNRERCAACVGVRRKNKPEGSRIERPCWCQNSPDTCSVHVLGRWLEDQPNGARPWARVHPCAARDDLRRLLGHLKVPNHMAYRTHDLRRGEWY